MPRLLISQVNTAKYYMLAVALGLSILQVDAAQLSGQFNITVNLQTFADSNSPPKSAFCRSTNAPGSFGATVTVVCATGAMVDISPGRTGMPWSPMHGGAYRYILQASRDGNILGTVDSYVGIGTVTSWRVVNLVDRDYIEMLINW
ncbi:MAG: hypothetical protein ABIP37_05180 [Methylotenera sp.]